MVETNFDVVIIGGGPAGSVAAIYAARSKRRTLLIDSFITNGATGSMGKITQFPGLAEPVSGAWLIETMRQQAHRFGTEFRQSEVKSATVTGPVKSITLADGETVTSRTIILSTGCMRVSNTVNGEKELYGKGVHYSALQAGSNYDGHPIAVFGKSQHTIEETLYLARYASKIYLIIPGNKLDVDDKLADHIFSLPEIEPIFSSSIKSVNGDTQMDSVTILSMGQDRVIPASAIFIYTHSRHPLTDIVKGSAKLSEDGCVLVDNDLQTSVEGLFAAGDILCGDIQQPVIAAAQGAIAAMAADRYLTHLDLGK